MNIDKWDVLYNHICYLEKANLGYYEEAKNGKDWDRIIQFEIQFNIYNGTRKFMEDIVERYE